MRKRLNKNLVILSIITLLLSVGWLVLAPAQGMYPMSEISKLDLVEAGLKINPDDIYNPEGVSLTDALVSIRGCTGSFISDKGLILTNHHCGFGYVSRASTTENNYLRDGFLAKSYEDEFPAVGNYCKITESYKDVSEEVLSSVENVDDPAERIRLIKKKMEEIGNNASDPENDIEAQVSEMFIGKTYILFTYKVIRDVRIVYVPPLSIGNFGGETDNWVWPRHTGDFTFMRAYVATDGSSAKYSKENVPYQPKKYLKINPNGVDEGDFLFILGYPGRTFRNRPAKYYEYRANYVLPYISKLYDWVINKSLEYSQGNPELELKLSSPIKSLANVMKKYKGQLKGFRKLNLVEQKRNEEQELLNFINSDKNLKNKYDGLFSKLNEAYTELHEIATKDLWLSQLTRVSGIASVANSILSYSEQMQKDEADRSSWYKGERLASSIDRIERNYNLIYKDLEKDIILKMITDASSFDGNSTIDAVEEILDKDKAKYVSDMIDNSVILKKELSELLSMSPSEIDDLNDPLFYFLKEVIAQSKVVNEKVDNINGRLNLLLAQLVDLKRLRNKDSFIPDANSTLRLTYGYVKGYSPADAVYNSPITKLDGIIEKNSLGLKDYRIPEKLKELYNNKDWGKFYDKDVDGVPVAILYNTDTTGGNSGSPILNAYGELIGLNFDRATEATINDYAWDDSFSRSIGVDIRYILWVAQKFSGADNLLQEIGI